MSNSVPPTSRQKGKRGIKGAIAAAVLAAITIGANKVGIDIPEGVEDGITTVVVFGLTILTSSVKWFK